MGEGGIVSIVDVKLTGIANSTSLGSDCNDAILFTPDYSNFPEMVGYSRKSVNIFR
tara:strand:+ start:301 stop:468 length:168 start_codon:yes stop_codon:yes gene_type:complete